MSVKLQTDKKCENCLHYQELKSNLGECRIGPPVIVSRSRIGEISADIDMGGYFPEMFPNEWCSHFESKIVIDLDTKPKPLPVLKMEKISKEDKE